MIFNSIVANVANVEKTVECEMISIPFLFYLNSNKMSKWKINIFSLKHFSV